MKIRDKEYRLDRTNAIRNIVLGWVVALLPALAGYAQPIWQTDFSNSMENLKKVGRGVCEITNGVFRSQGAYACFGNPEWSDYRFSFKARALQNAEQVQIWAGFRTYNRFDRYVVGIKGGLQDDLYLMRTGYMGMDEFMGVRPLGFHPIPGEWYKLTVEVCGQRIRVFVNEEKLPHIDVLDKNAGLVPSGEVSLGGGWITTEFDDLKIEQIPDDALDKVKTVEYKSLLSVQQKEERRRNERANYQPIRVAELNDVRTEVSLDGNWLFMPNYQLSDIEKAISPAIDDNDWHVMQVPNFWNPICIWLHGETMPSPAGPQPKGVSDTYYQQETERCENYTFNYRQTKFAWYRQWVELPANIKNKQCELSFDAVSKIADVYVNGTKVDTHIGMFASFRMDITSYLKPGRNLIVVGVTRDINGATAQANEAMENYYSSVRKKIDDNKDDKQANKAVLTDVPHGFYQDNPAGIWQPVKLTISNPLKVDDVFIRSSLNGAEMEVTVKNSAKKTKIFCIVADIIDKQTGKSIYSGFLKTGLRLPPRLQKTYLCKVTDLKPQLWEPQAPHLYDFRFTIQEGKNNSVDCYTVTSGFRTFESKDGFLYLNGHKYWLRGGNHIPAALCPNDSLLADRFMQLMRKGNVNATRTHTTPWNELWVAAADRNGILISFEGTWPWLMIHSTPIPNQAVLDLWKTEWLEVMKKFRNHPSIVFWTVNNEMKFYDLDADLERSKQKFQMISDVVKDMRKIDPTRPVCFDSNYLHSKALKRYGDNFLQTVDDGDIDDNHAYYNWYDYSLFHFFNGEFQQQFKSPGRPLISQEMSTGYPNNETGHPTRSYQLIHQNPFTLVGYKAYDWADPAYFLKAQAFITGELAEALRRTNEQASGIMHFAYMTWLRQCYDAVNIQPYPTYYAMQRAMQPVLVSAELWGRHFYAGDKLKARIYVVNDDEQKRDFSLLKLHWQLLDEQGKELASENIDFPAVSYYARKYIEPYIRIPSILKADKVNAKLKLSLMSEGNLLSQNEYDLLLTRREWCMDKGLGSKCIYLLDKDGMAPILNTLGIPCQTVLSVKELLNTRKKADLCIVSGLTECSVEEAQQIRAWQSKGGNLLLLNCKEVAKMMYPEYIKDWIIPTEGDIAVMEQDDAPVFDGIDALELRYFNNNKRELPQVCHAALKVIRDKNILEWASQMKIHAYLDGEMDERMKRISDMRGLLLLQISDGKGVAIVSTLCTEKALTDPIAGKLLTNMINQLTMNDSK